MPEIASLARGVLTVHDKKMSPTPQADHRLQTLPRWPWRTTRWRQGATGWRRQTCVAGRSWRVTSDGQRHVGWLVGEGATRGQPEERRYDWSTVAASATREALAGAAHRREAVEPCQGAATGGRGWDQDQGRLWPGFPRHAVAVMLAYRFVVGLEWPQRRRQNRRGRPRDPCSPAAGPATSQPASDPS
jgi:hypothetical protein